jgi:hypothetical protein
LASERDDIMALQLGALRDALIEAGASVEKAGLAAEEVAAHTNRLGSIEHRMTAIERRLTVLQWMLGFSIAMTAAIMFMLFYV